MQTNSIRKREIAALMHMQQQNTSFDAHAKPTAVEHRRAPPQACSHYGVGSFAFSLCAGIFAL
jgi:hypothetical protein